MLAAVLTQEVGCLLHGDHALGRFVLAHQRDLRSHRLPPKAGLVLVVLEPGTGTEPQAASSLGL